MARIDLITKLYGTFGNFIEDLPDKDAIISLTNKIYKELNRSIESERLGHWDYEPSAFEEKSRLLTLDILERNHPTEEKKETVLILNLVKDDNSCASFTLSAAQAIDLKNVLIERYPSNDYKSGLIEMAKTEERKGWWNSKTLRDL